MQKTLHILLILISTLGLVYGIVSTVFAILMIGVTHTSPGQPSTIPGICLFFLPFILFSSYMISFATKPNFRLPFTISVVLLLAWMIYNVIKGAGHGPEDSFIFDAIVTSFYLIPLIYWARKIFHR